MATKSKRRTTKRSSPRKSSSNNTTYMVVGVLVVLMLVLLYIMTRTPVPTTTTTQPSLVNRVINAVSNAVNNVQVEGFEGDDNETKEASELYDPETEVLVVFCKMEGCGHCVKFNDNVWSKTHDKLNGAKTNNGKTLKLVTVSKDAVLSKDVSGFPTIKKFGDDAGNYVEFTESRTVENFTNFCMS